MFARYLPLQALNPLSGADVEPTTTNTPADPETFPELSTARAVMI
jgi:hypothetical protein